MKQLYFIHLLKQEIEFTVILPESQPTLSGDTECLIYSGYEGGMFSGGYRPRVNRFLEAIPKVRKALARMKS